MNRNDGGVCELFVLPQRSKEESKLKSKVPACWVAVALLAETPHHRADTQPPTTAIADC